MSPWLWAPAAVVVVVVLLNVATWARPRAGGRFTGRLSVLIPARNEALNIVSAVEGVFASDLPVDELIVYDDGSTDATPALLEGLAGRHPKLRVVQGTGLPAGWVGKPHACHHLGAAAQGDVLLFLDADVRITPDGLSRLARALETRGLDGRLPDVVTAVPAQVTGTLAERLLLPLLVLTYTAWLPLGLIRLVPWTSVLAANGQVLMVRRPAYERVGGFAAVRQEVVDDMAFCRRVKAQGGVVHFIDGAQLAACRMYRSGAEVADGFAKNIYEGLGGSVLAVLAVITLYLGTFVLPYAVLLGVGIGQLPAALLWPAAGGVAANLATRGLLAWRHGHPLGSVLLHPVAVVMLAGIALRSVGWAARGTIRWRGRTYAAREHRGAA